MSSALSYDIHYWIGSQSSQDEQGAAAVYTIQLDEFLGSTPVQHREVQSHESDTFRGYFKQGIMWASECKQKTASWTDSKKKNKVIITALFSFKKGGVASGMRHTETNAYDVKRLLHVKGKKRVIAKEVSQSFSVVT